MTPTHIRLPKRLAFGHKGSYGHVLVIGGHEQMGGAVIMAAEAAFHAGAGKVTVVCHRNHHQAILSRAPNIMLRDINNFDENSIKEILSQVDAVCFGMGLGRDEWAQQIYQQWFDYLNHDSHLEVVLDADALWFLAKQPKNWVHIFMQLHILEKPLLYWIVLQRKLKMTELLLFMRCNKICGSMGAERCGQLNFRE